MYWRISGILLPVLVLMVIGLGVWGYQENQEKNAILIKAENQYQRAFHELNYHMEQINDELTKALAINTRRQLTPCLTEVWRLAYAAQNDVGQLPLTLMPFNKTEEFLSNIGDFSYRVAVRDLEKEPLTAKEWETLKALHKKSKEIQNELTRVQTSVIDRQLRWMDVETALAEQDKKQDNTIINGFKTVDKRSEEYGDLDWGPGVMSLEEKKQKKLENISGTEISKEKVKDIALDFVGLKGVQTEVEVVENGKGLEYESYSVKIKKPDSSDRIHLDISKKGGHVIWVLDERDIQEPKLSMPQAEQKAQQFLKAHGYANMERVLASEYDNLAVITFAYTQGKVRVYPDEITVKVARDNGDVIGFQAFNYLLNHHKRNIPAAKISEAQARKQISSRLKVKESRLALIENDKGEEVLCYELLGTVDDNLYKVFINAQNGEEEEVEILKKVPV